jgi:hypothetical protein
MKNQLIMGKRLRGKTTLALYLARKLGLTICVFDINRQFDFPAALVADRNDLEARLYEGADFIVFRPGLDIDAGFEEFAQGISSWRDLTILVDESSRLQGGNSLHPWLDEIIRRGRDIHLLQTIHRPSDAANICRVLASDWYIFKTRQAASLACVADQCGGEVAEIVASLGEREYVHWNDDAETFEKVTDAAGWFELLAASEAIDVDLSQVLEVGSHAVN